MKQKIKGELYTSTRVINNLLRYIQLATPEDVQAGKVWYHEAQGFCRQISGQYDVSLEQAAGVTAIMSAQTSWDVNKMFTRDFLMAKGKGRTGNWDKTLKARKVLKLNDPVAIERSIGKNEFGALKTRNFFWNLHAPELEEYVTVDTHAISACILRPENQRPLLDSEKKITPNQYGFLKDCYIESAAKTGFKPNELQAIVWTTTRRLRGLIPTVTSLGYMEANPF